MKKMRDTRPNDADDLEVAVKTTWALLRTDRQMETSTFLKIINSDIEDDLFIKASAQS